MPKLKRKTFQSRRVPQKPAALEKNRLLQNLTSPAHTPSKNGDVVVALLLLAVAGGGWKRRRQGLRFGGEGGHTALHEGSVGVAGRGGGGVLPAAHRRGEDAAAAGPGGAVQGDRPLRHHRVEDGRGAGAVEGPHPLRHPPHPQVLPTHGLQRPPPVRLRGLPHGRPLPARAPCLRIRRRRPRGTPHRHPL